MFVGVVANKVYAVVLGPSGVGTIALILPAMTLGALAAGLGLGTSVVQLISSADASRDGAPVGAPEQVARRLTLFAASVLAVMLILFREQIAAWVFGTPSASMYVLLVAPAIVLTAMAYLETGILAGHQRIREIVFANVFAAGFGMLAGVSAVLVLGISGFAPAVLVTAAAHYLFVRTRTHRFDISVRGRPLDRRQQGTRLIQLGASAWASQLVSAAALFLIPVVILHVLGDRSVGLWRAASIISVSYLTVVLSTLSYEFLPRIARMPADGLGTVIDQHMRLLLGAAVPLILGLFALGPYVIELLFSGAFGEAMSVLQWHLVGDLLRLPAWALAVALLARSRGKAYLGLETAAGLALILAVPLGLQFAGLEGVGMGYAVAQGIYLMAAWAITSRLGVTAPGRLQAVVVVIALMVATSILVGTPHLARVLFFGILAVALAAVAIPRLYVLQRRGEI